MCFTNSDGWLAEVYEEEDGPAPKTTRCDECGAYIFPGQWRRSVLMREHEECQACEAWGDESEPCEDDCHDYGESWEGDICERCHRLREAVRTVEEAEGCHGEEAVPCYGFLREQVDSGAGWQHYADEFVRLGLWDALPLIPFPYDPADFLDELAFPAGRGVYGGLAPSGVYANAVDPDGWLYAGAEFDIGGEG